MDNIIVDKPVNRKYYFQTGEISELSGTKVERLTTEGRIIHKANGWASRLSVGMTYRMKRFTFGAASRFASQEKSSSKTYLR